MANHVIFLTVSNIKYLLVVYELEHSGCGARSTDVAQMLHVTKPSVHRTAATLKKMGLIDKDRYGAAFLTETGKALAGRYVKCHAVLYGHFQQLLPPECHIQSVSCAVLAQLTLEAAEHMCAKLLATAEHA